jgi:molybdate transport system permease protein
MRRSPQPFSWILVILAAVCAAFFLLPLVGLVARAPLASALGALGDESSISAIRLSLVCSLLSTALALVLGVPLAWVLARLDFPGKGLLRAIATLPMVLPPVVGGVALLLAFGRRGLLGGPLASAFGLGLPFTTPGVILAESFVAMPFLVITVEAGLRSMDVRFEEAPAAGPSSGGSRCR